MGGGDGSTSAPAEATPLRANPSTMAKSSDGGKLSKKSYEARLPEVRAALVRMQFELKSARFPVVLVVAGVEASGKGDVVNILNGWLDPRGFETFAFHEPTDEERDRPAMWRYWRTLPPSGRMAIYSGGWHTDAINEDPRTAREIEQFDAMMRRISWFEGQLAASGALIVKVWLSLSKSAQRARLQDLESDPRTEMCIRDRNYAHGINHHDGRQRVDDDLPLLRAVATGEILI